MRWKRIIIPFFLLFLSAQVGAVEKSAKRDLEALVEEVRSKLLWEETAWLRLLHYRRTVFGRYRSEADGGDFFLAGKGGKTNPQRELEATLRGFFADTRLGDQHPQCRFPARFAWFQQQLGPLGAKFPKVHCPEFDRFRRSFRARSVTLVFSSYYLNNPASAFGHTLLRINHGDKTWEGEHNELLDDAISYAADVTTPNPLLYAILGIGGGFRGVFSKVPYYYKVREYNDAEARDLWGYDLRLTSEEVQAVIAHLWELGSTHFDYYYLTENCSYHLLTILEAADPSLTVVDPLPYYVIPSDTLKVVLDDPTLVTGVHYRPAVRTEFDERLARLTRLEKGVLKRVLRGKDVVPLDSLSAPGRRLAVLDAAIDYADFKFFEELVNKEPEISEFKQKLLVSRSELGVVSPDLDLEKRVQERPDQGHDSARSGIRSGYSNRIGSFISVTHRFALHDLLDPTRGYPQNAEIEFLNFEVRKNLGEDWFWMEEASLFNVYSMNDWDWFHRALSWKFRLGGRTFRDEVCANCFGGLVEGGIGLTRRLVRSPHLSVTVLVEGEGSGSPKFRGPDARFRYGPRGELRIDLRQNLRFLVGARYRRPLLTDFSVNAEAEARLRWGLGRRIALDLQGRRLLSPDSWEGGGGLFLYF